MSIYVYDANKTLREQWDDTARTYTAWDATGSITTTRPYTADENAVADAEAADQTLGANKTTLQSKAQTALANNATFLGIASPTNTQVVAQVKALTRQVNALIRLELNELSDVSNT